MTFVAFDSETYPIEPGLRCPPMVCGSFAELGREPIVLDAPAAVKHLFTLMWRQTRPTLVGANVCYDLAIVGQYWPETLTRIFEWYEEGRVYDIQIAQALDAIAQGHFLIDPRTGEGWDGRYSLDKCVDLELGRTDAKANQLLNEAGKLTLYGELDSEGVPVSQWPQQALQYPKDDALNTLLVAQSQVQRRARNRDSMAREARAAFALHLGSVWGLRVDGERLERLAKNVEDLHASRVKTFTGLGFIHENGKENTSAVKKALVKAYGGKGVCRHCAGTGKVPSPAAVRKNDEREKLGKKRLKEPQVICRAGLGGCDGTGMDLASVPNIPRSAKEGIRTNRDTLMESGDDTLTEYADDEFEKVRTTYVPFLRKGVNEPLNLRPNVLVSTFRSSYDGVIQQMPRRGEARACFKARPGYVFCSCDYSGIELCTLAQACIDLFGHSGLADTLNSGKDVHSNLAAYMMSVPYEEAMKLKKLGDKTFKDLRQAAKPINFGLPGGMGDAKLVGWAREKTNGSTKAPDGRVYAGIRFCILLDGRSVCGDRKITTYKKRPCPPVCEYCVAVVRDKLRPAWLALNPEMPEYFRLAGRVAQTTGKRDILGTVRGGMDFTQSSNDWFQRRAALGMKEALWHVTRECYLRDLESPLYGTRIPMAIHDELFMEMPEAKAHDAGLRAAEIMVGEMRKIVPDVRISVEPTLMRYWQKDAEPVYRDGKLIPWEDRHVLA